jgi:hypothetical protein
METKPARQEDRAIALLADRGMARLSEFIKEGITAAAISRMEQKRLVNQLSRGLYQLPDALLDANGCTWRLDASLSDAQLPCCCAALDADQRDIESTALSREPG